MQNNEYKIKKENKIKNRLILPISVLILIVAILSTIMYAHLTNLDRKIASQEAEISELKKNKLSLEGEVVGIKSSSEIAEEAMYKLGMVYPSDDQIIYIELDNAKESKDVNQNVFLSPVISVLKSYTKD
ncbi:septum formation initiator family protein [Peptoniphilus sp. GNH]|nr:putative cell division protein FtsL [Clostridiales bacterium KA00134]UHR03340.1 septum formation initiator family protein [Peptoniphilus sp. GNH]